MTSSADLVRISADPISQEEVTRFVTDPSAGGISIFLGEPVICERSTYLIKSL